MKEFPTASGCSIFSIRSDIFWLKYFVNTNLKIRVCKVNPLLRNLGYNTNSTQNQTAIQTTVRNLSSISSIKVKLSNESIP